MKLHRLSLVFVFALAALYTTDAQAQYRNNGIYLPSVGTHFLGCAVPGWTIANANLPIPICGGNDDYQRYYASADTPLTFDQNGNVLTRGRSDGWGTTHHLFVGSGYFRALGYNLWLDIQLNVGIGGPNLTDNSGRLFGNFQPVISVVTMSGIRYNFLDEEHRPFISAHVLFLYMPNTQGSAVRKNEFLANQSLWVGPRLGGGYEWFFLPTLRKMGTDIDIFYDEMSLIAEGGVALSIDLAGIPLVSQVAKVSYNIYF